VLSKHGAAPQVTLGAGQSAGLHSFASRFGTRPSGLTKNLYQHCGLPGVTRRSLAPLVMCRSGPSAQIARYLFGPVACFQRRLHHLASARGRGVAAARVARARRAAASMVSDEEGKKKAALPLVNSSTELAQHDWAGVWAWLHGTDAKRFASNVWQVAEKCGATPAETRLRDPRTARSPARQRLSGR
jgi:hypothetical protein